MTGFGEYLPLPPFSPHVYDKLNEKRSMALSRARPVARTAEDMAVMTNGDEAVPPEVIDTEETIPNQHVSSIEHDQHPDPGPDFEPAVSVRNSPSRSSVRVRMPPGGNTTGFW